MEEETEERDYKFYDLLTPSCGSVEREREVEGESGRSSIEIQSRSFHTSHGSSGLSQASIASRKCATNGDPDPAWPTITIVLIAGFDTIPVSCAD